MENEISAHATVDDVVPETPWGMLPPSLRVLFVCEKSDVCGWIAKSLEDDSVCKVTVDEALNPLLALEQLRETWFDAVLVAHEGVQTLDWIEALRVGSTAGQPILVLGSVADREFSALCFESGADGYLTVDSITTRELIWHLARASERRRLMEENDRNRNAENRRRSQERDEVLRVLDEQRRILHVGPDNSMPDWLVARTRELLSTYVVMGTGQLAEEMNRFVGDVACAKISQSTVLRAFHSAIEKMVEELGTRSSKHVLNRGNVLLLESLLRMTNFESIDSRLTDV